MTRREQELSIVLRRLVDSLKQEPFFPDSEKYRAMENAQTVLETIDQSGSNRKKPRST